jgi:hypothetical protein
MAGPSISPALRCRGRVEYVRPRRQARALRPRWHVGPQVGLPVENATSVIFGGPNLDIAYVTSMKRVVKRVRQREREAGGLFAVYGRARRPRHSGAALPGLMSSWAKPIWNSPACRGPSGIATRAILV